MPLLTLRELAMLGFMNRVTDKPGWEKEVGIVALHSLQPVELYGVI